MPNPKECRQARAGIKDRSQRAAQHVQKCDNCRDKIQDAINNNPETTYTDIGPSVDAILRSILGSDGPVRHRSILDLY